ncbi:unnamed protein product [Musa acuminata subsp. burmannicoides]
MLLVNIKLSDHKAGADNSSKQSRSEKKSRKATMKLGMKPVTGASKITIKRTKTSFVILTNKALYKLYINVIWSRLSSIFSKNRGFELPAAQQFRIPDLSNMVAKVYLLPGAPTGEDEEEIDESGLEPRDIDLVMTQAGVSRAKAVKALKTNNGAHRLAMQIN